ncbi:MAG: bifunctional diaminohydroxyphosphoribosylaminopyrimidine deaminase/5-amino-6-(5-phosphoribosylamino)uracil reductase RibD [Desulfobacterales bacterium]|nr:bifunctional diaminohydroxyphosphoribosylaminopyrimidine deaminase/5-amino-6-(5-phosphoribosylamino)uracil reductase RibD [Desulfobacterales bacterium]
MPPDIIDKYFMKMAISLARQGYGFTSPNPMVGAVIVKDNKVVGKGFHLARGLPHAEVNAINDAGNLANGSTLYVTLEPCNHFGRTPPCVQKIIDSGIVRVVIANKDPNPNVKGNGSKVLAGKNINVTMGVCKDEAAKLNEVFFKYIQTKQPFVILKCASTLDGRIASRTGDSKWISSEKSREFVHWLRHSLDAIMVGIGTVKTDNPFLTTRIKHFNGKNPIRIVLDTNLSIDINSNVLNIDANLKTIIVAGNNASDDKAALIEKKGAKVIKMPCDKGFIDIKSLMEKLGSLEITSLLIEGGSSVISSSLKSGVVDKVIICYAPKILGGDDGVPICRGEGAMVINDAIKLKNIEVLRFENDVMIEGYL